MGDQQVRKGVAIFTGKEEPAAGLLEDRLVVAVGAKCMAYDVRDDKWYKSSIVALQGDKAKIHYDGWGPRFDTWCVCGLFCARLLAGVWGCAVVVCVVASVVCRTYFGLLIYMRLCLHRFIGTIRIY